MPAAYWVLIGGDFGGEEAHVRIPCRLNTPLTIGQGETPGAQLQINGALAFRPQTILPAAINLDVARRQPGGQLHRSPSTSDRAERHLCRRHTTAVDGRIAINTCGSLAAGDGTGRNLQDDLGCPPRVNAVLPSRNGQLRSLQGDTGRPLCQYAVFGGLQRIGFLSVGISVVRRRTSAFPAA